MARFSVRRPRLFVSGAWLTTADAAKALELTRHGVRYLVHAGELRPTLTPATGQWLFARTEILETVAARARRRLRARGEVWRALRLVARQTEPRQLALPLWGPIGRKVTTRPRSEPGAIRPVGGVSPISPIPETRGAGNGGQPPFKRRRMAKADLHGRQSIAVGGRRR